MFVLRSHQADRNSITQPESALTAADVTMRHRAVSQTGRVGLCLYAGGAGRYTRSDFVHLDCGPVRKCGA